MRSDLPVNVCRPHSLFGIALDSNGRRRCAKCGVENQVRVVINPKPDKPEEQPEDQQIRKLLNTAAVVALLGILSAGAPLCRWLIDKYLLHLAVPDFDVVFSGTVFLFFLAFGLVYFPCNWLQRRASRLQAQRIARLARTEQRPPILLLRSFFNSRLARHARVKAGEYVEAGGENIIKTLELPLAAFGRPVALGVPKHERPDSGRQQIVYIETSDEDWQRVVLLVACVSRFVLMVPGWTDGVVNEMELIGSGQLSSRTIVLMPPSLRSSDRKKIAREWNRVKERCAASGFRIPSYDDRGMLYIPNADFSVRTQVMLQGAMVIPNPNAIAILLGILDLLPMIAGGYGKFMDALASAEEMYGVRLV